MENRVQIMRQVIEFFPVYESYPKRSAGDVRLSPTLIFLGMMILLIIVKKKYSHTYKYFQSL